MWRFSRRKEEIRLETWYDKYTSEFIADIAHPGGERESKRFLNHGVFRTWLETWGRQLCTQGWTQSGPFLFDPERPGTRSPDWPVAVDAVPAAVDRTARTYAHGRRIFEVLLARLELRDVSLWTVEQVAETSGGNRRLTIPAVYAVASPSEDVTFAQACDCIDTWLSDNPETDRSAD